MKIMICGSMTFSKEMLELEKELEKLGHDVVPPLGMEPHLIDPLYVDKLEDDLKFCLENDVMMINFNQVAEQDAIIVFNKKKNNIDGYIGVSTLMEMAIAYYLKKKIFIMYDIPHYNDHRWAHEVTIMQPTFLHNNLENIM